MMTFSPQDLAHFMRSNARRGKPAVDVLNELNGKTGAPAVRKSTPAALVESAVSRVGRKLSDMTAGDAGWVLWPFPLYPSERVAASGAQRAAKYKASGRRVDCVIRDPGAVAALRELEAEHGGTTAAVTFALKTAI